MFSCKNGFEPQGEIITVKLNPTFISLSEDTDVPMNVKGNNVKMSANPNEVIYAIQIFENDSAYYYGLFDEIDSMKIAMTTGKNYRFKIATYKVGTGNGLKQEVETDSKYFYLPNKTLLGNKFIKGNALKDINLISSIKLTDATMRDYPEIDVFYCDKTILLEKGSTNIDFNLLRMGFGVTYSVEGLSNGKLNIIMGNDTTVLSSTTTTDTSVRLFNDSTDDLTTIFTSADSYADSIPVKVQWIGTNGTILNTEGKFKFKRNYMKTITIQINLSNLNLNLEGWSNAVTDIDGNIYHTVTIGTQTWMVENLKTTKYSNGELIGTTSTPNQNIATESNPKYQWAYNGNENNVEKYGRLYTWYAVADSRKIAPIGWHVPSDTEWTTLENYLIVNGYNYDGTTTGNKYALALASNVGWNSSTNVAAVGNTDYSNKRNASGFTALPGGARDAIPNIYGSIGNYGLFWSSSMYDAFTAWDRGVDYSLRSVGRLNVNKSNGYSVRCIKD